MIEHPRLRELAMKRHVGGLISFSLLTLITGGCQPDAPIGVPVLAARVEPKPPNVLRDAIAFLDRKSTRLNSSHGSISYAVFCLKKKTRKRPARQQNR